MGSPELTAELGRTHEWHERGGTAVAVHRDWLAAFDVEALLAGLPVAQWGRPVPHALAGRGAVHLLDTPRGRVVSKRLERGGLLAWLLRRRFLDATRPFREAAVAEGFRQRGGRTPHVVAARCVRGAAGLATLDLATEFWPSAGDLSQALHAGRADATRTAALARAAGATLRRAHDLGLRHRDLHVRNLLVPEEFPGSGGAVAPEELVVLDLDRCQLGESLPAPDRRRQLARFFRSLARRGHLPLPAGAAAAFLRAYARGGSAPAAGPAGLQAAQLVREAVALAATAIGSRRRWGLYPAESRQDAPPAG